MNCEKCGKEMVLHAPHTCVEPKVLPHQPNLNFQLPVFQPKNSSSYEMHYKPISPNPPENLTLEEVLSNKSQLTGFLRELNGVFTLWKNTITKPSKGNIILLVTSFLLFILWIVTKYIPGPFSYMMPGGIKSILGVALGTFNNVPARVLHFSSLVTLAVAFIPYIATGNSGKVIGNFKSTIQLFKKFLSYKTGPMLYIGVIALGTGMFFANFLMRNNASNKYAVCLTLGLTTLLSTSGLFNSTFVRLCKGLVDDVTKLLKVQQSFAKYKLMIQLGFGTGLILSFVGCIAHSVSSSVISDKFTYILGTLIIIAGIILLFSKGSPSALASGKSHD